MKPYDSNGEIITFYSYKGGTGRSMAAANVGWILASQGFRVLMIDWDLEAPGLSNYFHPFMHQPALEDHPGLIDFVIECATDASDREQRTSNKEAPPISKHVSILRYIQPVEFTSTKNPNTFGPLHIITAGRRGSTYGTRVNTFDWQQFYSRYEGRIYLDEAKKQIKSRYDYIIIDSRTGVSDTAGICTVHLPDTLAIFFTANTQSLEGAFNTASSVWRQWNEHPEYRHEKRRIYPFMTRVETSELDKLEVTRDFVRAKFDQMLQEQNIHDLDKYWLKAETPYIPFYAYEEVMAVFKDRSGDPASILGACENIVEQLTDGKVTSLKPLESYERKAALQLYKRTHEQLENILSKSNRQNSKRSPYFIRYLRKLDSRKITLLTAISYSAAITGSLLLVFGFINTSIVKQNAEIEQTSINTQQQNAERILSQDKLIDELTESNNKYVISLKNIEETAIKLKSSLRKYGEPIDKAQVYRTCRHAEFGQIGWVRSDTITESSGWVGGGSSQSNWCNTLTARIIKERSIGSSHSSEVINKSEQARWTGIFGRVRQYNYSCTVKIQWEPLYAENTDPLCGKIE